MDDWKVNLLALLAMAMLGAGAVLFGWYAWHFITWTPLANFPSTGLRAGFVVGGVLGAIALVMDS